MDRLFYRFTINVGLVVSANSNNVHPAYAVELRVNSRYRSLKLKMFRYVWPKHRSNPDLPRHAVYSTTRAAKHYDLPDHILVKFVRSIPIRPIGWQRDIKVDLGPNRGRSPLCFAGIYNIRGSGCKRGTIARRNMTELERTSFQRCSPSIVSVSRGSSWYFRCRREPFDHLRRADCPLLPLIHLGVIDSNYLKTFD